MDQLESWIRTSVDHIKPFCSAIELASMESRLSAICEKEFSRGVSELVVARYYADNYADALLIPRGNKKDKDIDVSFIASSQRVNIEVKCPDLSFDQSKKYTLHVPYLHRDFKEGKKIESDMKKSMLNDLNVVPNKVLNFNDFLDDCRNKFQESAEADDINVVLFSMLDLEWMDNYRIKIEEELLLKKYESIHAVVLSSAAYCHRRGSEGEAFGLEYCLNYVIPNTVQIVGATAKRYEAAFKAIPNQTKEIKAWYATISQDADALRKQMIGIQRLKLYFKSSKYNEI